MKVGKSSNPYKCGKWSGASQVLCDISGFPPRCGWGFRPSGMLRSTGESSIFPEGLSVPFSVGKWSDSKCL